MTWLDFVRDFRKDNPTISYKDSLKRCKGKYQAAKKKQTYCPKLRPKKKDKPTDPKISKSLREKCKEECGIQKIRKLTPKKRRKPKKMVKKKNTPSSSKRRMAVSAKQSQEN